MGTKTAQLIKLSKNTLLWQFVNNC